LVTGIATRAMLSRSASSSTHSSASLRSSRWAPAPEPLRLGYLQQNQMRPMDVRFLGEYQVLSDDALLREHGGTEAMKIAFAEEVPERDFHQLPPALRDGIPFASATPLSARSFISTCAKVFRRLPGERGELLIGRKTPRVAAPWRSTRLRRGLSDDRPQATHHLITCDDQTRCGSAAFSDCSARRYAFNFA
jgi:hypothetical protein